MGNNDRRAINIKQGMRRARKEGRYMGIAPIGYDNKTREDGSKYIAPHPTEAPQMQWIFKTIAEGIFAPDQIRKMANEKGFMISRTNFYREVRNPVYCGKIVVKKFKDEEETWVDGLHEPLISEGLFYEVQDVLSGRKIVLRLQAVKVHEYLPLKGILQCDNCDRKLTGSASKGRNGYYYYYHAQALYGCGCRYKADELNIKMTKELDKYTPVLGMQDLYQEVALDVYKKYKGTHHTGRKEINEEINALNERLNKARNMLFDEKIDSDDYKIVKKQCEEKLKCFEIDLSEAKAQHSNLSSLDKMLSQAIEALSQLKTYYVDCDALEKREVLGSIFREIIRFDGMDYRTARLNEGAQLIYLITKELKLKKTGSLVF